VAVGGFRFWLVLALCASGPGLSAAQQGRDSIAGQTASGEIRISGSPADRNLIEALEVRYRKLNPALKFSNTLHGPESTLAGVYTGTADLAFMARELREPMERMAFQWVLLTRPFEVTIAYAGLNSGRDSDQIAIFVNSENPLTQLSLPALDALFGAENKRGKHLIRQWGEAGLPGAWQQLPVHVLGPDPELPISLFFRRRVMLDSRKWNPGYRVYPDTQAMFELLQSDRASVAFGPASSPPNGVRTLPVAADEGGAAFLPNRESVMAGSYPLDRVISVVLFRADKQAVEANMKDFLLYLLSPEGQRVIETHSDYLPLNTIELRRQRERLN